MFTSKKNARFPNARETRTYITVFAVCLAMGFLVDSAITYVPDADTDLNHLKTVAFLGIMLFLPMAAILYFRKGQR